MSTIAGRDWRFLLLEGVMVVASVLFALFVEDWREERELQQRVDAAMEQLVAEVEQNRSEMADLLAVVTERRARLGEALPSLDGTRPLSALVSIFGGYRTPDLANAAWERVNRGLVADRIPAEFVDAAFLPYSWAEQFDRLDERISDLVYGELFFDPGRVRIAAELSMSIMQQQMIWSNELIGFYDAFLVRYGETASAGP